MTTIHKTLAWLAVLTTLIVPVQSIAADSPAAGTVVFQRGGAFANRAGMSLNLAEGTRVHVGDEIITGKGARLALEMTDGAVLSLGADTAFVIRAYDTGENTGEAHGLLELVRGAFRAVSGQLGKVGGDSFRVRTQVATIGVRGTDFWGGFHFSEALDVALLAGAGIYVENAAGRVEITEPGAGTTVEGADKAPSAPKPWGDQKLQAAARATARNP